MWFRLALILEAGAGLKFLSPDTCAYNFLPSAGSVLRWPQCWEGRDRRVSGPCWPAKSLSSRFSEKPPMSQKITWVNWKRCLRCSLSHSLSLSLSLHTHKYTHTHFPNTPFPTETDTHFHTHPFPIATGKQTDRSVHTRAHTHTHFSWCLSSLLCHRVLFKSPASPMPVLVFSGFCSCLYTSLMEEKEMK